MVLRCIFSAVVLTLQPLVALANSMDHDGDSRSDITFVRVANEKNLRWKTITSSSNFQETVTIAKRFGELGNHLSPGHWAKQNEVRLGHLSRTEDNEVRWTLRNPGGENPSFIFGGVRDFVLSGGDYNGNGFLDAATITPRGGVSILTDPFGEAGGAPSSQLFEGKFARKIAREGVPIFLNADGAGDKLGFVSHGRVKTNSGRIRSQFVLHLMGTNGLVSTQKFFGKLKGKLEQAMPIIDGSGRDVLAIISTAKKTRHLTVWRTTGDKVFETSIAKASIVVVGSYLPSAGQEFGILHSGAVRLINPFTLTESSIANVSSESILVDEINIVRFVSPGATLPGAGLSSVCSSIAGYKVGILWKPESEVSDNRGGKPVILLTDGNKTGTDDLKIYAVNGVEVCNFTFRTPDEAGVNENSDHYYSGWYGGCDKTGSQIASLALEASGSEEVYFGWKDGACVGPANPKGRHGSIR